ncbi:MAG: DNA repair protein RadC [Chloroflexi bacterium]|nr:DNA repair protein RadC [Chloroflexota bacterium]
MKLHYLPVQDHPVRRVAEAPTACNTIELLAALVGGPRQIEIAEDLLKHFGSLRNIKGASAREIAKVIKGVGQQTAARLISALELGRRLATDIEELKPSIMQPQDIADLVMYEMSALEQEELRVMLVDTRSRLIDIIMLYRGSKNSAIIKTGEVFKEAIRQNASGIILIHNHPTGDPAPSPDDVGMTRAIVEAGKLLDIDVLDRAP